MTVSRGRHPVWERIALGWKSRRTTILRSAAVIMACAAVVWLGYEFWRLFLTPEELLGRKILVGGVDLKLLYDFTRDWFSGIPIYRMSNLAVYPPASYVLVWPIVGWTGFPLARLIWTVIAIISLAFLVRTFSVSSGASDPLERVIAGLVPLATYPSGASIGNGQLTIPVLACLTASLLILSRAGACWRTDITASLLFLAALVKPHISAPFFWMALFIPGRVRPAAMIAGGYSLLTLFAASPQDTGLFALISDWLTRGSDAAARSGYSNFHLMLAGLGLGGFGLASSLVILAMLGFIIFRLRRADLWTLMGITAITARLWTYHQWFDDLLIAPALIALLRIAHSGSASPAARCVSGILAGACLLLMLAPGGHFLLPQPWKGLYLSVLSLTWLAMLAFLVCRAWPRRCNETPVPAGAAGGA